MLDQQLESHRQAIIDYLSEFLVQQRVSLANVNRWADDVLGRLEVFAGQGKALRGCLVAAAAEMYGRERDESVLAVASSIELLHASLLVHDDIMDNDRLRRGQPTLLAQYEQLGADQQAKNTDAYGRALATCFGDLGFFLAWQLFSRSGTEAVPLTSLFSREMAIVGLAQMADVAGGLTPIELDSADIEAIYIHKTARYTFSLPLMCGAMLAGQSDETLRHLERLGEYLGLMFQLKDDELGLFGDSRQTGKPVGSDISENKKTLLRLWLFERSSDEQRTALRTIFGSSHLDDKSLDMVRTLIDTLGVRQQMEDTMAEWAESALIIVDQLAVGSHDKEWLRQLVVYNGRRMA